MEAREGRDLGERVGGLRVGEQVRPLLDVRRLRRLIEVRVSPANSPGAAWKGPSEGIR